MQPDQLAHIVKDLSLLHEVSAADLEAVVAQYPYFAMAHVLLLKKYQLTDADQFNRYLPMAAIYVADRKRLHAFVEAEIPAPSLAESNTTDQPPQPEESASPSAADELLAYLDERHRAAETAPVPQKDKADPTLKKEQPTSSATVPPDESEEQPIEETTPEQETLLSPPESVRAPSPTTPATDGAPSTTEQHTFSEWLQRYAFAKTQPKPTEPAPQTADHNPLGDPAAAGEAYMAKQLQTDRLGSTSLITGNNPVAADEIEAVEGQARKSVEMGDELVTETLAKIFLAQGNLTKTLETYEKLRLKYPEKSDYFAAQIQKLQEKKS